MFKKILITTLTILIAVSGFLTGFFSVGVISVYAAVNDDSVYVPLRDPSDAVIAFQAYCKSRDLTIEGSLTDAVTTFTTGAFNSACNEVGINISELQAEIKAEYDSLGKPVKFFFNDTGVMAMNRIFAQFLQDNELEVGDTDVNKLVYSGLYFTDADGNSCMVFVSDVTGQGVQGQISYYGTPYKYNRSMLIATRNSDNSAVFNLTDSQTVTKALNNVGTGNGLSGYCFGNNSIAFIYDPYNPNNSSTYENNIVYDAYPCVYKKLNSDVLYFGFYNKYAKDTNTANSENLMNITRITNGNSQGSTVFIVATIINSNNYEGDTYITNEGDVINNPSPQPTDPNDTIHNVPETPLSPNDDGGWDIDLPDIDIPNLPLGNLSEKFPFSIPWDLVAFYAMLDAEPEAPRFNGTMDLTLVQWNYDIDLSPFDSAAELCRKLQFGLFVVGLIVASRSIIRG